MELPRVPVPTGGMTLVEYLAQLTPEQRAQREDLLANQRARATTPDREQEPILADLRAIGVEVHSVWSQFLQPDDDPRIYEILMCHLQHGGYKPKILEGIAHNFSGKGASKYWQRLRELYLVADAGPYRDALAGALGASARREHVGALIELLGRKDRGDSRVMLMRKIKRLGGERGLAVIEAVRDDPELGVEARILIKRNTGRS